MSEQEFKKKPPFVEAEVIKDSDEMEDEAFKAKYGMPKKEAKMACGDTKKKKDMELDEFAKKAMLNFEDLFKDCQELDGMAFEEKYGIDKMQGKQILDSLWLKKLSTFGKDFEVYADMYTKDFAKKVKEVEIFEVGYHNGMTFKDEDIEEIVKSTNKMMKEQNLQIPIKLGHSKEQEVAKAIFGNDSSIVKDAGGMPALGWVKNLKKVGKKIVADLTDIPDKLYNMLEEKLYATRSIELWEGFVNNKGENVGSVITGLALLGAVPPAVTSLANIFNAGLGKVAVYESVAKDSPVILNTKEGETTMTDKIENPVVVAETKQEPVGFDLKEFKSEAEVKAKMQELKKNADEGAEAIKQLAEFKKNQRIAEKEAILNDAGKEGQLLPFQIAMLKPVVAELENSEVEYFDMNLEVTKKGKVVDLFKAFVKSLPNQVQLKETSKFYSKDKTETLDDVAKQIMMDKKVTYEVAVKEALRTRPELSETDSIAQKKGAY